MPDITATVGPAVRPEVPPMPTMYTFVASRLRASSNGTWYVHSGFIESNDRDSVMRVWPAEGSYCFPVTIPGDADRAAQADMVAVPRALVEAAALMLDASGDTGAAAELRKCLGGTP